MCVDLFCALVGETGNYEQKHVFFTRNLLREAGMSWFSVLWLYAAPDETKQRL